MCCRLWDMTERNVWLFAVMLEDYTKLDPHRVQATPCCLLGTVASELSTELPSRFDFKGAS